MTSACSGSSAGFSLGNKKEPFEGRWELMALIYLFKECLFVYEVDSERHRGSPLTQLRGKAFTLAENDHAGALC